MLVLARDRGRRRAATRPEPQGSGRSPGTCSMRRAALAQDRVAAKRYTIARCAAIRARRDAPAAARGRFPFPRWLMRRFPPDAGTRNSRAIPAATRVRVVSSDFVPAPPGRQWDLGVMPRGTRAATHLRPAPGWRLRAPMPGAVAVQRWPCCATAACRSTPCGSSTFSRPLHSGRVAPRYPSVGKYLRCQAAKPQTSSPAFI